ncbi:sodium-dependent glucose transporter-like protein [Dinothrombium tinctorium]|uniref:Sodium-dependent glucose transporter-like protein n=1 Tax=Dinothrombium tinctorium TaxID=1965070 RepID=A0A443RM61_9ACAR|nr:sodium-dependent glucose transporter-like protein [Dinothrombium tinctorium]
MSLFSEIRTHKYTTLKTFALYLMILVVGLNVSLPGVTLLDLQLAVNTTLDRITAILPSGSGIQWTFIWSYSGNVWILHLWGTESPPFIQSLHFAFGCGALIGPLIAEPFLLEIKHNQHSLLNSTSVRAIPQLKVHYPYMIVASFSLIVVIIFGIVYFIRRSNDPHPTRKKVVGENEKSSVTFLMHCVIVFLSCSFLFFYIGLELSFGTMLTTYVVNSDLKLDKSTASYMTSVGIILMGLGTSPIFGALFGFLQDFIFLSSKTASILFVSGCVGQFIIPYLIGNFVDKHPSIFLIISSFCGLMACMLVSEALY